MLLQKLLDFSLKTDSSTTHSSTNSQARISRRRRREASMPAKQSLLNRRTCAILVLLIFGAGLYPAFAGDSLYGRVTAVKSAEVVVLESGKIRYDIRMVGIDAPKQGRLARDTRLARLARQFVADLVLGKNARVRLEYRNKNGEMVCRLMTDDPVNGIKDVGVELLRAGLGRRQSKYDYKYGELAAAEDEARNAKRGLWAYTNTK